MLTAGAAVSLLLALSFRSAQMPAAEPLPAPRVVGPAAPVFRPECWRRPPPHESQGAFAVDRYGVLRPRIVLGPYGHAYYAATGEPYLYLGVRTAP